MVKLGKQLKPKIEKGVVKYDLPVPRSTKNVRQFAAPPPPTRTARVVIPKPNIQRQEAQQQKINPRKVTNTKGCSGCKRNIGKR